MKKKTKKPLIPKKRKQDHSRIPTFDVPFETVTKAFLSVPIEEIRESERRAGIKR